MNSYLERLKDLQLTQRPQPVVPTQRVMDLSVQINVWYKTLPVPDCWRPISLGRTAAMFGSTRELTASALQYGGWKEQRAGAKSMWHLPLT